MGDLLSERFLVNASHELRIIDLRLTPGQTVEVIVRAIDSQVNPKQSFLKTAQAMSLSTPQDYSVAFEQALRAA
jgi:hypothetical protein